VALILASASPRRAELLTAAGFRFHVRATDVDESIQADEDAERYVRRVAEDKARAACRTANGEPVLAADTAVLVGGEILGKPRDAADARRMLRLLSGRTHHVITGVCLVASASGEPPVRTRAATTAVECASLTAAEVDWYIASGEPIDKAGGYAIQGLASRFVTRIDGSYSNVVGLPVALVYEMCSEAGILLS
jgi:septum formation protein